jgi:hypothetical protein
MMWHYTESLKKTILKEDLITVPTDIIIIIIIILVIKHYYVLSTWMCNYV